MTITSSERAALLARAEAAVTAAEADQASRARILSPARETLCQRAGHHYDQRRYRRTGELVCAEPGCGHVHQAEGR